MNHDVNCVLILTLKNVDLCLIASCLILTNYTTQIQSINLANQHEGYRNSANSLAKDIVKDVLQNYEFDSCSRDFL